MINLYTSRKLLLQDYPNTKIIIANDEYFKETVSLKSITLEDFKSMELIDGIEYYDNQKDVSKLISQFGPVEIYKLSTGCKTAINLSHTISNAKVVIDLTSAGENAIERCFELADNTGKPIILCHSQINGIKRNFEFKLNGSEVTSDISRVADLCGLGDRLK